MVAHSKKEHGKDGTTRHYRVSSRVEHECLVCKKPVMHENKNLTDHMHKIHHFNLATYEERHYFPSLKGAKSDTAPPESDNVESKEKECTIASVKSTATNMAPLPGNNSTELKYTYQQNF